MRIPSYHDSSAELAELHQRWCVGKEKDHLRSLSPSRATPTTLHAAKHHQSLDHGVQHLKKPPLPPANKTPLIAPCPPHLKTAIFMPDRHFTNVHSHYATAPANEAPERNNVVEVVQIYDHVHLEPKRRKSFDLHQHCSGIRLPARKRIDLERLPPLSDKLAEEIKYKNQLLEEAAMYAKMRQSQEEKVEKRRRSDTAQRYPTPLFRMGLDSKQLSSSEIIDPLVTETETTQDALSKRERARQARGEHAKEDQNLGGNRAAPPRIQWGPNLIQRKQRAIEAPCIQQQLSPRVLHKRRRSSNGPSKLRKVVILAVG